MGFAGDSPDAYTILSAPHFECITIYFMPHTLRNIERISQGGQRSCIWELRDDMSFSGVDQDKRKGE